MAERFHLENLLQAPTWEELSKRVLFVKTACGTCRPSKLSG